MEEHTSEKGRQLRKKSKPYLHLRGGEEEEFAKETEKNGQRGMRRNRKK